MAVALYMDHQVSKAITDGLRLRGVDVLTASEDNHRQAADADVLDRATTLQRLLFSQDKHFLGIAHKCLNQQISFYGLVYAHQLLVSVGKCVEDLELMAKTSEPEDVIDTVYFLPL